MNIKGAFALSNMLEVNTTLTGLFIGCKVKQENGMKTSFICDFFQQGMNTVMLMMGLDMGSLFHNKQFITGLTRAVQTF